MHDLYDTIVDFKTISIIVYLQYQLESLTPNRVSSFCFAKSGDYMYSM